MNKNIALVGFMGSGKSTVAKLLAEKSGRKLVSTDELIIDRERMEITDIFSIKGEKYFRNVEEDVVFEVSRGEGLVIDCGGGVVLREQNINNLRYNGTIVYLKTSSQAIYRRIKDQSHRPLLNVENPKVKIAELLIERASFYEKADLTVDTDGKSVEKVVEEIIKAISHESSNRQ
ncbi:MAG: shikimate kinase [Candidatus Omnitrophica bacterium]|nr:shikimate kinase [Candidatus Omnitrophota bacterium]